MRKILPFIFMLVCLGYGAMDVDVYIDGSRGAVGLLTADTLDSMAHGTYTGQINDSAWLSTTVVNKIPGLINLNGQVLSPDSVFSIGIRNKIESNNVEIWYGSSEASPWPPYHDSLSFGFIFHTTALSAPYSGQIDWVVGSCNPSGFYVVQSSYEESEKPTMRTHGDTGGVTTFSASDINIDTGKSYWCTARYTNNVTGTGWGACSLMVYDMSDWSLVDTPVGCLTTANSARSRIRFGRCTPGHGGSTLNDDTTYFQTFVIDTTDATFPLLPDTSSSSNIHWVSATGTGTWSQSESELTPCLIDTANAQATDGDTVYILNGAVYDGKTVTPTSDGVTYIGVSRPIFTNCVYPIEIDGYSRCVVKGIDFDTLQYFFFIENDADSNTIYNNTFDHCSDTSIYNGARIWFNSDHNIIRKNHLQRWGYSLGSNRGDMLNIGRYSVDNDSSWYNLVDSNTFNYGGHSVCALLSKYCIFRDNYVHNDSATDGSADSIYGYRGLLTVGLGCEYNLIERNTMGFCYEAGAFSIRSSNNIVRHNVVYKSGHGFQIANYTDAYAFKADSNKIVHNSFFANGYGASYYPWFSPIYFAEDGPGDPIGNIVKNNIFWRNKADSIGLQDVSAASNTIGSNYWQTGNDYPEWLDTSVTQMLTDTPTLVLAPVSPCRDSAGYLTDITSSSGSGTSFTVTDAGYFCDGFEMISGDTIKIKGKETAVVTDVNYATKTITVLESITWAQGDSVGYKFTGNAPDYGIEQSSIYSTNFGTILSISGQSLYFEYGSWCNPCSLYVASDSASGNYLEIDTLNGESADTLRIYTKQE